MKKLVFITLGLILTALGIIGAFLPLLPTTPLLLAAAFFFARSSPKFHAWLMNNRICGDYLKNYAEHKGMKISDKIKTISFLWITIGLTAVFAVDSLFMRILLVIIAVSVSVHILLLRTLKLGNKR